AAGAGAIAFEKVGFAYPGGTPVLQDFNLSIAPGQRIGLVGESGGGKSNLFALLQRFYDVESGQILIDGQDIAQVTQESLRARLGVGPQAPSLSHRPLMENIPNGRPLASEDDVIAAAT